MGHDDFASQPPNQPTRARCGSLTRSADNDCASPERAFQMHVDLTLL